jgi:DNA-binding PadR family transcriptional regulator
MSLKHALLGFLTYQPKTGYELKSFFDLSVRHFWPADQSQIYRTLGHMYDEELVAVDIVHQQDRPDRKVYSITEAGRAELQRWLTSGPPLQEHRSAPLIQVFFAGGLSDEEALAIFRTGARMMQGALQAYSHVPKDIERLSHELATPRDAFFWALTLESGLVNARAQLEWMESVIRRIESGDFTSPLIKEPSDDAATDRPAGPGEESADAGEEQPKP